jgi:hypothetical protein
VNFAAPQRTSLGFEPHRLVSVDVFFSPTIRREGRAIQVRQAIRSQLLATPGIADASLGTLQPRRLSRMRCTIAWTIRTPRASSPLRQLTVASRATIDCSPRALPRV